MTPETCSCSLLDEFLPVEELNGIGNLIRMSAVDQIHEDLEAEARAELVALSRGDNSSEFAGMYRVAGAQAVAAVPFCSKRLERVMPAAPVEERGMSSQACHI